MKIKNSGIITIFLFILSLIILSCASSQFDKKYSDKRYDKFKNPTLNDKYRIDVAYKVKEKWDYSKNSKCTGDLKASIIFSVLPNGEIKNLFFHRKSGCVDLDDSARSAIERAAPFEPFPKDLKEAKVFIGLNFVPEGVK